MIIINLNFISILTTILFSIGHWVVQCLTEKNILIIIMSIELMLLAVSTVTFINAALARFLNPKLEAVRPLVKIVSKKTDDKNSNG